MSKRIQTALLLLLIAVECSLPVGATCDSVATPFYTVLAWSPDETRALTLVQAADGDPVRYRLADMDVQSGKMVTLEESESYEWREQFQGRIDAMSARGYRPGRILLGSSETLQENSSIPTLPKPMVPAMNQQLLFEADASGFRLILRESLPGIETAVAVLADLTERMRRECPGMFDPENRTKTKDIYIEEVYVSPSLQWAFVPITAVVDRLFSATYYCVPVTFRLARESSRLYNTCGYRLYLNKDYPRAEEQFLQAIFMDPLYAQALYNLACVCALIGRSSDAGEYLGQAIAIDARYKAKAQNDPDLDSLR